MVAGQDPPRGHPLVSVLIPAYNAEQYLAESLRSVLAQDITDLEVIVVDDGSADGTAAIVTAMADPRIRLVQQANKGIVEALNNGLDRVRGEFVSRLDADDLMGAGRLRAQLGAMAANRDLVVCGTDYALFTGDVAAADDRRRAVIRMPRTDRACRARLAMASCHASSGVLIRTSALERSGARFREQYRHAEDYRMWCELSEWGTLANLPLIGLHYRLHPQQVSALNAERQRDLHIAIARQFSVRSGRRPIPSDALCRLLFPPANGRGGALGVLREGAAQIRPWSSTLLHNPSAETARFATRRAYEALAHAR